jgi:hypothetical protein
MEGALMSSAASAKSATRGVAFTAADLDRTIAHFLRVAADNSAKRGIEKLAGDLQSGQKRLPSGAQGPHSPTD